jgi:hypothetical protein
MVPAVDEGPGAAGVDQEMRDQCGSTSSGEAVSTVKRLVTRYRPARTLVEQSACDETGSISRLRVPPLFSAALYSTRCACLYIPAGSRVLAPG